MCFYHKNGKLSKSEELKFIDENASNIITNYTDFPSKSFFFRFIIITIIIIIIMLFFLFLIVMIIRRAFQIIFNKGFYHFLLYFVSTFFQKCLGIITFTLFENGINHYLFCYCKALFWSSNIYLQKTGYDQYFLFHKAFIFFLFAFYHKFLYFTKKDIVLVYSKFLIQPLIRSNTQNSVTFSLFS